VLLEAMAARVPIVATLAGGIPEIVSDQQTALLVPALDSKALGLALERLLKDEALRVKLVAAAYERANTEFSPMRYRQNLTGIYRDVLQASPQ
jgi:glycosyltransferase involved in cell wall biosynthesis